MIEVQTTTAARPYVLVIHPGEDREEVVGDFATAAEGRAAVRQNPGSDLMKRRDDGTLTTEF